MDFKEYLLNNPLEAKKYGEIKVNLSKQFPFDHEKYQEGEQEIANELVFKAKEWAIKKQNP